MKEVNLKFILKNSKKYLLLDIFIWLVAHNIPIILAYLLKLYFDENNGSNLLFILLAYIILFFLRLLFIKVGAYVDIKAQHKWSDILYEKIIKKANDFNQVSEAMTNQFIDIIQNDISSIVGTISYGIDTFCNVLGSILAFFIMASINLYIALVILLVPIIIFLISNFLKNKVYGKNDKIRANESNIINKYQDIIKQSRKIRINSLENEVYHHYSSLLFKNMNDKINYDNFKTLISIINDFMVDLNIIIILLGFTFYHSFQAGDVILFINYSFIINDLATYISSFTVIYNELKVYIDSFNAKLGQKEKGKTHRIDIKNIINNLKLGQINILIGENGSGKTRALKQIAEDQNYDLVLKNSSVISESLYLNLVLDNAPSTYEKVKKVFSLENLEEREKLSEKELSGGQLDRISLARAIIGSNPVILVDNNLSSIDTRVRKTILEEFEKSNRTFLLVDQDDKEDYENYNKIYMWFLLYFIYK